MAARRNHIDRVILFTILFLMVASTVVVYSASSTWAYQKYGAASGLVNKHIVKVLAGFAVILFTMNVKYTLYRKLARPAIIGCIILLTVTLAIGGEIKGASRWLNFAGFNLQPSEAAKIALIFLLSGMMAAKKEKILDFHSGYLPLMLWIGGVVVLVMLQPNFSTGAMIACIGILMLFIGGAQWKHLLGTLSLAIPALIIYMVSAQYRMKRVMAFLGMADGSTTPSKSNYQLWQGIIGFGNGGLFGVGMGESKQRDLFLPESYGDFVFSIIGEEYGFIGTVIFLTLFFIILMRGFRIAKNAPDDFGRYLAIGITSTIVMYALGNALVTLGVFPTTGLPMPFVSYGGSSIIFSSFAIGVLLNISSYTDLHPRAQPVAEEVVTAEPAVGKVY